MAEIVGLAASIVQLGGAGVKLSIELHNFITATARADKDALDLADSVGPAPQGAAGDRLVAIDEQQQCAGRRPELGDVVHRGKDAPRAARIPAWSGRG